MNEETLKALRKPFADEQIGKLPKVTCGRCSKRECGEHQVRQCRTCKSRITTAHIHIDYVGHAHVTERLLEVDPGWSWEPLALDNMGLPALDDTGGLWIKLTVGGKTMLGYGDAPGKRAAVKELIGDAIRNASMRFGVALDLWKKEAPEPVPERQTEEPKQTSKDQAAELRGQISVLGKQQGKTVDQIADDFALFSRGKDIRSADVALLAEYKASLERGAP